MGQGLINSRDPARALTKPKCIQGWATRGGRERESYW